MWALGWHQSRWGYKTDSVLRDVMYKYEEKNLPLDTIWSDIDYMDRYQDFTYDPVNFALLPKIIDDLHENNLQYIPIIDAGIAQREGGDYEVYNTGVQQDVFVKAV